MTIPQSHTGYEPNSEFDMAGRFVPIVELTHNDEDTNSLMSDVPLQLPASAHSAMVTFSQVEGDFMRNIHSLQPIPNQTGVNRWQPQYPVTYPQSVLSALGPQEAVQLVKRRAREAWNDQRETFRRALLHEQGWVLAATHQYEAAAKQNLVNTLTNFNEAQNYNVQIQVRA